jgi:CDP-paratose 2-epimerase
MNPSSILITGGAGFVGSNLALKLKSAFPHSTVYAFDNLKRRGSELNIKRLQEAGVEFIHGDIRNASDFNEIGPIDLLIEAAAEPSVLSGIQGTPDYVLQTNLIGTLNCLHFAHKHKAAFLFLSTSRIYPIDPLSQIPIITEDKRFNIDPNAQILGISPKGINEQFTLEGARSFYGASKLSSELIIQEYAAFYQMPTIINRCGVITGPWQMGKIDQGVVVLWMAKHYWKKELSYIGYQGSGKQVRDMLHIDDLYDLILHQIQNFTLYQSQICNVGGGLDVSASLLEMTEICTDITGNKIKMNHILENRAADIPIYISDNSKIQEIGAWQPKNSVKSLFFDIFNWIRENENLLKPLLS